MTPFEVLGLDPAAATDPAAVRAAYARLIRLHRPDRDPEGFRRLRDAYEALTTGGGVPAARVDATRPQPSPAPPVAAPAADPAAGAGERAEPAPGSSGAGSGTTPADPPLAMLDTVLAGGDERALADALARFLVARRAARALPRADGELAARLARHPALLAALAAVQLVELAAGGGACLDAVITVRATAADWPALTAIGQAWLARDPAHDGADAGRRSAWLAGILAVPEGALARRLADDAFLHLDRAERVHLGTIDFPLAIGADLVPLAPVPRHALAAALVSGTSPSDPALRRQLARFLAGCGPRSAARAAVADRLPALAAAVERETAQDGRASATAGRGSSGSGVPWWGIIIVVVVLVNTMRLLSPTVPRSSDYRLPQGPWQGQGGETSEQLRARLEESLRSSASWVRPQLADAALDKLATLPDEDQEAAFDRLLGGDQPPWLSGSDLHRALLEGVVARETYADDWRVRAAGRLAEPIHADALRRLLALVPRIAPGPVREAVLDAVAAQRAAGDRALRLKADTVLAAAGRIGEAPPDRRAGVGPASPRPPASRVEPVVPAHETPAPLSPDPAPSPAP